MLECRVRKTDLAKQHTLNKQQIIRSVGRQTGLRDTDVAEVIEAMIELLTAHLAAGGRIEIQHFLVLEVQVGKRQSHPNKLQPVHPVTYRYLKVRPGQNLRRRLNELDNGG